MKLCSIVDEYGYKDYDYLESLIDLTIKKLDITGSFSITFIDDERMHEMNYKYRNVDRTTDVLSFALNDGETIEEEVCLLGDIFISIPKMKEQAKAYGHSEKRELSFLAIHGLLHLLGYDHLTKEEEKIMFDLEEEILTYAGITK